MFLVEIASRPDYRLVERDLETGEDLPRFVVPETGVISSMAPAPDGEWLIMAYSTDYTVPGTGLYRLPLTGLEPPEDPGDEQLLPVVPEGLDVFFDDVSFGSDPGLVWVSWEEGETSAVAAIDLASGEVVHRIEEAVEPAAGSDRVAYLIVEADQSRRSIGLFEPATGEMSVIEVLDGRYDLGNLLLDERNGRLLLTALVPEDEGIIQLGEAASAHGAHDGPTQWLSVDATTGEVERLLHHEPVPFRDATMLSSGEVAAIVSEGLIIVDEPQELVFESRVLGSVSS